MNIRTNNWSTLIVGLGMTGLSAARYLAKKGVVFAVADSRMSPPGEKELSSEFPDVDVFYGDFDQGVFLQAKQLVVSPGIAVATAEIQAAKANGAEIVGDIELFVRDAQAPVIAITGSNGKSTVTTLLAEMLEKAGLSVLAGGNLGNASLDLLNEATPDVYVMELSSFQLETTQSLQAASSTILNVSEDHMDRYDSYEDYVAAKMVVYENSQLAVVNREDKVASDIGNHQNVISFGMDTPTTENDYGVITEDGQEYLAKGTSKLMPVSDIALPGRHNIANALAALALAEGVQADIASMLEAIKEYAGLDHRTQWVRTLNGVNWFNDSKGTNVGATIAALSGLPGKTVLIAGGQGKGADFSPLTNIVAEKARGVVLFGEDKEKLAEVVQGVTSCLYADDLASAVEIAASLAKPEDNVLLSPACASFDMFPNYVKRGEAFVEEVRRLEA